MKTLYAKVLATILALFFLSSCAVWVRDEDGYYRHHRRYWRHSSLQQSDQSPLQMAVQDNGGSGGW